MRFARPVFYVFCSLTVAAVVWAVTPSEMDDFQAGTENWQWGVGSGPTQGLDCGPAGPGDNCLINISTGTTGPGSNMAVFNRTQWTGNYNTDLGPEVEITMDVFNAGSTTLNLRLGVNTPTSIQGNEGIRYVSDPPIVLLPGPPPNRGPGWQTVSFTLSDTEMVQTTDSFPGTLQQVLDNVTEMRILSAASNTWQGDNIAGELRVDNIRITQLPVSLQSFSIE